MTTGRGGADIQYEAIASGGDADFASAYLAKPASAAGHGIIVIHDEAGLGDFVRDVCDRLARAGFVALAPDLFHACALDHAGTAKALSKELDIDAVDADLESAVAELYNQNATSGSKVGALGFGLGGSLALFLSSRHRRIGAVADLCGTHPEFTGALERVGAPVLAILAGGDESVAGGNESGAESAAAALKSGLARAGVDASVELRAGVRGGYLDEARLDVFDAVAAAETWDAVLAFFRSELA